MRVCVCLIVYCRSLDADNDLLADEFFKQNRMILSKTLRTPICIDPQFKAIECIKAAHQHQNNVKFLRLDTTNDAVGELIKAITLGEIVVLEDVHAHIDPILMDLLEIKLLSWFTIHFSHRLPNLCMFYSATVFLFFLFLLLLFFHFAKNHCACACILIYVFLLLVFFFFHSICSARCLPSYVGPFTRNWQQTVCKSWLNRNRI